MSDDARRRAEEALVAFRIADGKLRVSACALAEAMEGLLSTPQEPAPAALPKAVREAAEKYRELRDRPTQMGVARLAELRHQACRVADAVLSALDSANGGA